MVLCIPANTSRAVCSVPQPRAPIPFTAPAVLLSSQEAEPPEESSLISCGSIGAKARTEPEQREVRLVTSQGLSLPEILEYLKQVGSIGSVIRYEMHQVSQLLKVP